MNSIHRNNALLTLALLVTLGLPTAQAERVNESWVVKSGDGLYGIARQLAPKDLKMQARIRNEITRLNPNANTNNLAIGLSLTLPAFLFEKSEPAPVVTPAAVTQPAVAQSTVTEPPVTEPPAPIQISQATEVTPDPQDIIGRVVIQTGDMVAENRGSTRSLKRTANILQGDTLKTSGNARSQIRLKDGALLAISPGTELKFEDFAYNGSEDGSERSVISLIKGGFRTITGAIGHVNKQNYQVRTSVATIGIRGTHYGLMLCEAGSCQNNPENGNLDDGLYGGVVDGSIVTDNQSGTTTFNNDQYFHIETAQTAPLETLLPPPVFNDNPARGDKSEENDMAGPPPDPNGKPPEDGPQQPRDMASLPDDGKPPEGSMPGDPDGSRNHRGDGFGPKDGRFAANPMALGFFSDNGVLPPKDGLNFNPPPLNNILPPIAPEGAGMAFSFMSIDLSATLPTPQPDAPSLVMRPNNFSGIFLKEIIINGVKDLLPVGMHEEHDEFDIETNISTHVTHNAAIGDNAQLANVGRVGSVIWGRWQGDYVLQESINTNPVNLTDIKPVILPHVSDLHFIYSDNLTTETEMAGLGGIRGTIEFYKVVAGTLPTGIVTDATGNVTNSAVGTALPTIIAALDFNNQQLISYAIDVNVTDASAVNFGSWSASLNGPVRFADLSRSFNLVGTTNNPLNTTNCPSCYGQASLLLVGNEAGAAMSSYSIFNPVGSLGVNGVALLTPAGGSVNTPGSALFAISDAFNPTAFGVSVGVGSIDSVYINTATNVPTAAFHMAAAGGSQYQMMLAPTNPELNPSAVTISSAILPTGTAYWGRWNANVTGLVNASITDTSASATTTLQNNPLHFIHTSNVLSPTQLGGLTATANYITQVGSDHSFNNGAFSVTPTSTAFNIQANFGAQTFTYEATSSFSVTTLSGTGMSGGNPNIPFSQMNNFTLAGNTNCSTCAGNASLQFAGSVVDGGVTSGTYASHAITSYTLTDSLNHAAGVALLSGNVP